MVSSSAVASVTVDNPNKAPDWLYLEYLWITDSTGAFDIVSVTNAVASGDNWQINLGSSTLVDIVRIWQAHKVRLDDDLISEEYLTDSVMLSTFTVQELQGAY